VTIGIKLTQLDYPYILMKKGGSQLKIVDHGTREWSKSKSRSLLRAFWSM